jgi:hypothetical protein
VIVIGHQAIGVCGPIEPTAHLAEYFEKSEAVLVIDIDVFASITACGHVIQGAGELKT